MTSQTEKATLRIAVAQLNPTVGDVAGNLAKARATREDAARQGADLLLLTELFISGYPPEDLVLKPAFLNTCRSAPSTTSPQTRRRWPRRHHRLSAAG
jgi:NAD+ synthase